MQRSLSKRLKKSYSFVAFFSFFKMNYVRNVSFAGGGGAGSAAGIGETAEEQEEALQRLIRGRGGGSRARCSGGLVQSRAEPPKEDQEESFSGLQHWKQQQIFFAVVFIVLFFTFVKGASAAAGAVSEDSQDAQQESGQSVGGRSEFSGAGLAGNFTPVANQPEV